MQIGYFCLLLLDIRLPTSGRLQARAHAHTLVTTTCDNVSHDDFVTCDCTDMMRDSEKGKKQFKN